MHFDSFLHCNVIICICLADDEFLSTLIRMQYSSPSAALNRTGLGHISSWLRMHFFFVTRSQFNPMHSPYVSLNPLPKLNIFSRCVCVWVCDLAERYTLPLNSSSESWFLLKWLPSWILSFFLSESWATKWNWERVDKSHCHQIATDDDVWSP